MKKTRTKIGKILREIRTKKGLSQRELAKLTGISHRMIAHYETKASTFPLDKIANIAKTLNITMDELTGLKTINNVKPVKIIEKNSRFMNKLKTVESFNKKEQKQILDLINLIKKSK